MADPVAPYSGADTVDIIIRGVGAHGASPHGGIDPIVLGSQIVLGLQTVVSRELPPRDAGVITVGAFHAGTDGQVRVYEMLAYRVESADDGRGIFHDFEVHFFFLDLFRCGRRCGR